MLLPLYFSLLHTAMLLSGRLVLYFSPDNFTKFLRHRSCSFDYRKYSQPLLLTMPKDCLPLRLQNLQELAEKLAQGLAAHAPWIGCTRVSPEQFESAIQRLKHAQEAHTNAQNAKNLATKRVAMADKTLKSWLEKARLAVMLARGSRWSESWIHTGFTDGRTDIPKRAESRVALGRALISFFARHPEFSVSFANVTAAYGRSVYDRLIQSREMLHVLTLDSRNAMHQRESNRQALADLIRETVGLLEVALTDSDPRWADFGLGSQVSRRRRFHRVAPGQARRDALPFFPEKKAAA